MIGHSILLDGQGFPYLSEFCYHYLSGNENCAITSITKDDISMGVKVIVEEVSSNVTGYL